MPLWQLRGDTYRQLIFLPMYAGALVWYNIIVITH